MHFPLTPLLPIPPHNPFFLFTPSLCPLYFCLEKDIHINKTWHIKVSVRLSYFAIYEGWESDQI